MYNGKLTLAYIATDSFVLYIETEDVYQDFEEFNNAFGFSDYDPTHDSYDVTNQNGVFQR